MSPIFWDDRPPSEPGQRLPIPVWNLAPGTKTFIRFLGPWRGVWLHWHEGRTKPCSGDGCELCDTGVRRRWSGYAPALRWKQDFAEPKNSGWIPIICPITEGMAEKLRPEMVTGLVVELHRPGRRSNGAIHCTEVDRPIKDALPPPFDVEPILLRLWGLRPSAEKQRRQAGGEQQPDILPFIRPNDDGNQDAAEL